MTWGVEAHVRDRFGRAGVQADRIAFARDSYTFRFPGTPSAFVDAFRRYYGPTMNAFDAAAQQGRADALLGELEALFGSQNTGERPGMTLIPATFLRVTVSV
jgi:hypothetical protein